MNRMQFMASPLICCFALITFPLPVRGFQLAKPSTFVVRSIRQFTSPNFLSSKSINESEANDYDIAAASIKLGWERIKESSSRPILDLSSRDISPEEFESSSNKDDTKSLENWSEGQHWKITLEGLEELGVTKVDDSFLERCPQLLRLDPVMILETATWVIEEFGEDYLRSEPRLLSYPLMNVQYGLEFISLMMMTDGKPACLASTDFFLSAIEGGIQEQSVKEALGAAGDATSKATQTIAGDAMASLKSLRNRKGLS